MKNGSGQAKKVLFFVTKSNWGGAQRYVYDLATHLPPGYEALVAFGPGQGSDGPGALSERLKAAEIRTIFVPELGRDIGLRDMAAYRAMHALIRDERPDIVHLNSSKAGGLGAFAARMLRVPRIIFTAHGWPQREARNPLSKATFWLLSLATVVLSDVVICVSDADCAAFARVPMLGKKLVRIYNGIDLSMEFGSGETIRSAFPSGAVITGTIGELTANKNQRSLIEEAAQDERMHLAIVGEGEERQDLERLITQLGLQDRVKLFGFVPAAQVLRGFDTFALPSLKEGLPYVVIEARAAGVPVVANRTGGVGEILDHPLETFVLQRMLDETFALYARASR